MKLKNKLLPLVGVATACAAVAPLALTSCKSDNSDLLDLTAKYSPKITDIHTYDQLTVDEAKNAYFGAVSLRPEIFTDDFYWSQSRFNNNYYNNDLASKAAEAAEAEAAEAAAQAAEAVLKPGIAISYGDGTARAMSDYYTKIDSLDGDRILSAVNCTVDNEKITDFSIEQVAIPSASGYMYTWGVSFKREFSIEYATASLSGSYAGVSKQKQVGSVELHKIPVTLYYNDGSQSDMMRYLWWVYLNTQRGYTKTTVIDDAMLIPSNNSYIKLKYQIGSSETDSEGVTRENYGDYNLTIDTNCDWSTTLSKYNDVRYLQFLCVSHYMWNVDILG